MAANCEESYAVALKGKVMNDVINHELLQSRE